MILASQSPRRIQLLQEAGFTFRAIAAAIDERSVSCATPEALACALAQKKAAAVADRAEPAEPVIGSDTVVALDGSVLGKPVDKDDARAMLHALSARSHEVTTAVSIQCDARDLLTFSQTARVTFWELADDEIESYLATGEPFDKAGAYGIQGKGRMLVKGIEGDFYTVVGLPIARLARELKRLGVEPHA